MKSILLLLGVVGTCLAGEGITMRPKEIDDVLVNPGTNNDVPGWYRSLISGQELEKRLPVEKWSSSCRTRRQPTMHSPNAQWAGGPIV
jgi:hypothetical protein